jgi:hypothetical protein
MPALPSVPKVVKVDLHWKIGSNTSALSRMHFRYTSGPPNASDIQTFANDVLSKVGSRIMIQLPSDTSCLAVFAEDLDSATGATALSTSAAIAGTTGASARSAADAVLVATEGESPVSTSRLWKWGRTTMSALGTRPASPRLVLGLPTSSTT